MRQVLTEPDWRVAKKPLKWFGPVRQGIHPAEEHVQNV
jgi:hypothetical protein